MTDELTPEQADEIANALADGRKIEAIKLYREATGKRLSEAKQFIEALIPRLKEQDPQKYAQLSQKGAGCMTVVLLCAAAAWGVALLAVR